MNTEQSIKDLTAEVAQLRKELGSLGDLSQISLEQADAINQRTTNVLFAKANLNFASVNAGASSTITLTFPGARDGDPCVVSPPATLQGTGRIFSAYVSADDTVAIQFYNDTGLAVDLSASDYTVALLKKI